MTRPYWVSPLTLVRLSTLPVGRTTSAEPVGQVPCLLGREELKAVQASINVDVPLDSPFEHKPDRREACVYGLLRPALVAFRSGAVAGRPWNGQVRPLRPSATSSSRRDAATRRDR